MASNEEEKVARLANIGRFKDKDLDEVISSWKDLKSVDDLAGFIVPLREAIQGCGCKYVEGLNVAVVPKAASFFRSKDEAWRKRVFEALDKALMEGQWADFAKLDFIQLDPSWATNAPSQTTMLNSDATAHSWNETYRGTSHLLLWKHISNYFMKSEGSELYANMCAVVQSSGMGKSRTIDELGKSHFLIPVNLRGDDLGYPPPDHQARAYLVVDFKFADQARGRCFLFLIGLFSQTLLELKRVRDNEEARTKREMIEWFHRKMTPPLPGEQNIFREQFFEGVINIATQHGNAYVTKDDAEPEGKKKSQVAQQIVQIPVTSRKPRTQRTAARKKTAATATKPQRVMAEKTKTSPRRTRATASEARALRSRRPLLDEGAGTGGEVAAAESSITGEGTAAEREPAEAGNSLTSNLVKSARDLVNFLRDAHTGVNREEVEVVLAFDEAHVLCEEIRYDLTSKGEPWTMFIMLRQTLRCLYTVPVWGLFLSTTGKLSQFHPHHGIDPSLRIRDEKYKTVPAFTALRYDLFAPQIKRMKDGSLRHSEVWNKTASPPRKKAKTVSKGRSLTLTDVTKLEFIVRFGRPLFYLIWRYGDYPVKTSMIRFAMSKLICSEPTYLTRDWRFGVPEHAAFACLSQRLCIEFNSSKYNIDEEIQIASHMRLCLKVGPDNQFIVSSSGSEPVLAEAAATIMQMDVFKAAESLKHVVSGFAINKGDRGELVALLAVTRARDLAVKRKMKEIKFDPSENKDVADPSENVGIISLKADECMFRAVTVMEFLSQLFSLDGLKTTDLGRLSRDFKDAYIYFNHFVRPFDRSTCTLRFLMQYMTRGAAVLCSTNMPGIDALLGVLFKSAKGIVFREDQMAIILIQVKNDLHIRLHLHGTEIFQGMEPIACSMLKDEKNPRPVIRIVFSLGSPPELVYSRSTIALDDEKSVTTHDFWCGGIGDFLLPEDGESKSSWESLLSATMKAKELFEEKDIRFEDFAKDRKYLCPGGSQEPSFWGWVEELNEDIDESDDEEDRKEGSHSQEPRINSIERRAKVENSGEESRTPPSTFRSKRKR